jgi:hypothetical protein
MQRRSAAAATALFGLTLTVTAIAQVPDRSRTPSIRPRSVPDRPGTETTISLPAANFAMGRLPGAVQLLQAPGGWRARDVTVGTSGGHNPVTLTLDAGVHSALFQLAPPARGKLSSRAGRETMADPPAPATGPAEPLNRVLRFVGDSGSSLPAAIPVKITARDGKGATLSATTTFYPVAPAVSEVEGHQGKTTRQAINLGIRIVGLGAATGLMDFDDISGCGFEQSSALRYGGATEYGQANESPTDTRRIFRIARIGSASCPGLTFRIALKFPGASDYLEPITLKTPAFQLAPRQTYTFENTWDLQEKLGFAPHTTSGACQGKSEMPTQPSYPVGVLNDGGDITFKIRSGPVGTACTYASKAWVLPDGFELTKLEMKSTRSGPEDPSPEGSTARCCAGLGDGRTCSGMTISNPLDFGFSFKRGLKPLNARDPVSAFQVSGWDRPLLTPDNVILYGDHDNKYTTVLPRLSVSPTCLSTLLNDQFVTIRIEEIRFSGPPNATFP